MSGVDLTEFLLARIAEDEAVAQAAAAQIAELDKMWDEDDLERWDWTAWSRPGASFVSSGHVPTHIARFDPARVLAECVAKRRIVEIHALVPATDIWGEQKAGRGCVICDEEADLICGGYEIQGSGGCATLRLLALPYDDHPDYREEWRP